MKQKKLNNILYVFDVNPYIITQDTSAEIIKVQEESYDGFVEMNPSLAEKIVKYNYHLMCVKVPEWAPYAKEEDPQDQLTFGVYGADASTYIEQIQRQNANNEVLQHWDAPNITFPFQCNVNEGEHCVIEFKDDVNPDELDIIGGEYINIRWIDEETGHYWAATGAMHESISVGFNSYEPGGTVLNISGENTEAILKLEVYDHEGTKYDEWYAEPEEEWQKQLTFPFSTEFVSGDYFKFGWYPSQPPYNQIITGIVFENQWYSDVTYSWWTQTSGLDETVNMTVNAALDPETSWSAPAATVTIGADDNVFPTLSNPHNVAVHYWTSDSSVAAIDFATGAITLNNAGTTMIGATCDEQGYGEYPATYTLTVQAAQPSTYTVTLDGANIHQNVTVKMNNETVQTDYQYFNIADGTVVDIYPTGSVADYTLVSGAVWDTDHWTATVNGADLTITINYDTRADAELSWECNGQDVTNYYVYVTLGDPSNVFPTIVNPHSVSNIEYQSTDQSVATIDATTGVITLVGAGNTSLWADFRGDSSYKSQYLGTTLIVQEAQPSTYTVTLSGTDILQNATVKMDDVTVSTQSQYQNVADGTVVDVYPTGSVADYTLVSGATWSTDHWTATVNGADVAITINYAHDYSQDYLTVKALEPGTFTWTDSVNNNSINYSLDNGSTWNTLASGSSTPSVNTNDKVLFKASGLTVDPDSSNLGGGIGTFSSTGTFNASGNIMSLTDGDNFVGVTTISNNCQFHQLFRSSNIVDASNLILPATTLVDNCYLRMFSNCTSLTSAPSLPATTLIESCYANMFSGCTSLTTAPVLPATTLVSSCYQNMFSGCTSLNNVTCLAKWSISQPWHATSSWLYNVAASGTFTKNATMNEWTTGTSGIPQDWTIQNYSA